MKKRENKISYYICLEQNYDNNLRQKEHYLIFAPEILFHINHNQNICNIINLRLGFVDLFQVVWIHLVLTFSRLLSVSLRMALLSSLLSSFSRFALSFHSNKIFIFLFSVFVYVCRSHLSRFVKHSL